MPLLYNLFTGGAKTFTDQSIYEMLPDIHEKLPVDWIFANDLLLSYEIWHWKIVFFKMVARETMQRVKDGKRKEHASYF